MRLKKVFIFLSVVIFLSLFIVNINATKTQKVKQSEGLTALENLANTGKIPPLRKGFKSAVTKTVGENFGLKPQPHPDPVTKPLVESTDDLPEVWDWRDHNGVSPVGNQGYTGSCWVWGALKGFEANVLVASGNYYDLSERIIFNCNPWNSHLPASQRGGLAIMVANWLSTYGANEESCDPWGPPWNECMYDECYPPLLASFGWTRIPYDVNTIKKYCYEYGPIQTSMYASFPAFSPYDGSYCLYWTGNQDSNHSVQIVGWDDTMPYGDAPPYRYGAWICQNSWGTSWGDDGYFYIAYDPGYNANCGENPGFYSSYQFWPIPYMLGKLYYYDETGPSTWCGDPGSPDPTIYYGAVIFEATGWGTLRYIETWVPDGNTVVESWIYRSFNTGSPNGPQRLLRHQPSITFATGGFKRLSLSRNLILRTGDTFVVVLKVDCDTYEWPLAAEFCYEGPGCTYETGKCWESQDGSPGSWYDSGTWEYDLATRARAFRLTPISVKLEPYTGIVKIGEIYKIIWEYLSTNQISAVNEEYLTIDVVDYEDINAVIGKIADKVPAKEGVYEWKADDSNFKVSIAAKEKRYCIRVFNNTVIGISEPFKIEK
jgi:hypothetical protein